MTLMESAPLSSDNPFEPMWREVEDGFWVASAEGMFLGTIEQHGADRFFARDSTRTYVGEWATLEMAQTAVMTTRTP